MKKRITHGDYHKEAWRRFGNNVCDNCGITLEEYSKKYKYKRFDMHCVSIPKDYSIMISENWKCLCRKCHFKEENDKVRIIPQILESYIELTDDCDISIELQL